MKKNLIVLVFIGLLFACKAPAEKTEATEVKELPLPNEMVTLKLQEKLKGQYDNVWDVAEGFGAVLKDGKWGFVDTSGKLVIPLQFENPSQFKQGFATVKKEGKMGIINKTGKVLVDFLYDYIGDYNDGLFSARDFKSKYGFIDSANNVLIPFDYDEVNISWFSGGLAIMKRGNKYGAVDKTNKAVIPFEYDELGINDGFEPGYVVGKKANKIVLVDKTGQLINLPGIDVYEKIQPVKNNLLLVKEKASGSEGIIDLTGKVIIPIQYKSVTDFYKGYAIVESDSGRYLLDEKGKTYFEQTPFLDLNILSNNLFYGNTAVNDVMYLFDINGKQVVEEGFGSIIPMAENMLLVNRDGKAWYINYKGEKIADLPQ
ncbi:MAG: WG repeat-containing protein [Lacibacter sp.]|nr:WG repeat-containing protein [Lacibacter sp.]